MEHYISIINNGIEAYEETVKMYCIVQKSSKFNRTNLIKLRI